MVFGYCRISTQNQSIERQERNITAAYPDALIVKETFTGASIQGRKALDGLLKRIQPGDVIIFDAVDRMSRNAQEGTELYHELFTKGVKLIFLKNPAVNSDVYRAALDEAAAMPTISTGDADLDDLTSSVLGAVRKYQMRLIARQVEIAFEQAQAEIDQLHRRTREGMLTARLNGKQIGQKPGAKLTTKKSIAAKQMIRKHSKSFGGTLADDECMKLCGIARGTFYRYKRQLVEELNAV